jgi:hypothetical protein
VSAQHIDRSGKPANIGHRFAIWKLALYLRKVADVLDFKGEGHTNSAAAKLGATKSAGPQNARLNKITFLVMACVLEWMAKLR